MTQSQIDSLRAQISLVYFGLPKRHAKELKTESDKLRELSQACDHRNPDGSSAIEGLMFMNACSLCHANDM